MLTQSIYPNANSLNVDAANVRGGVCVCVCAYALVREYELERERKRVCVRK